MILLFVSKNNKCQVSKAETKTPLFGEHAHIRHRPANKMTSQVLPSLLPLQMNVNQAKSGEFTSNGVNMVPANYLINVKSKKWQQNKFLLCNILCVIHIKFPIWLEKFNF